MKEQLKALFDLQSIDIQLSQVNTKLAALNGTDKLKRALMAARASRDAAKQDLTNTETELKDSELKLKSLDERRTTFEKRLYSGNITNSKELSSIEKEIKVIKDQQAKLDQRTLNLYDAVEKGREKLNAAEAAALSIEKDLRKAIKESKVVKLAMENEVHELTSKREEALSGISDKALLSKYASNKKRAGGIAIAKVITSSCGACHINVHANIKRKLHEGKTIETCENCGRILMEE